jgi:hypothetical protein
MRVGVGQLNPHFLHMVSERFPQHIQFLVCEFEVMHIASIVGQAARATPGILLPVNGSGLAASSVITGQYTTPCRPGRTP